MTVSRGPLPEDLVEDELTPAKPHSLAVLTPPSLRVQPIPRPKSGVRLATRPLHEGWADDEDLTPPMQREESQRLLAATRVEPSPDEET